MNAVQATNEVEVATNSESVTLSGGWARVTVNGWIDAYFRHVDDATTFAAKVKSEPARETARPSIYR